MGGADSDESEEEGEERIMAPYNSKTRGIFTIYAALSHHRFFRKLEQYLREKDIATLNSTTHWSMTFGIERELTDLEIEEEIFADSCEIRVDLLKMPGEQVPTAAKFTQVQGSIWYFKIVFEEIK